MDDDGLLKYTVKVLTNYHNLLKECNLDRI